MSLESVAAAAGTTVPSLRRRYRNKAELVAAVIGSLRVDEPPAGAPSPRAHALAILENFHSNLFADLDALTGMLIGSFYARYVTIAGIPDDWPNRVLSAIWPPATSPAPPHRDHDPRPRRAGAARSRVAAASGGISPYARYRGSGGGG
jgi:AcrR family transcriptional regulator